MRHRKRRSRSSSRSVIVGLLVVLVAILLLAGTGHLPALNLSGGGLQPEGVDCALYGISTSDGLELEGKNYVCPTRQGTMSVLGSVSPNSWISYGTDSVNGLHSDGNKLGYKWVRPDAKTPEISIGTGASAPAGGLYLSIDIERPQVSELDTHGSPEGTLSPESIDWYSYNVAQTGVMTWSHYEAYVVPVDFIVGLQVSPMSASSWGAFESTDLWLSLSTNIWANAFTQQQMLDAIQEQTNFPNSTLSTANYRGAVPIWAWVGQWNPFQIVDQKGNIQNNGLPPEMTTTDLNSYLSIQPSWAGREVSIYPTASYNNPISSNPAVTAGTLNTTLGGEIGSLGGVGSASYYIPITLVKYGAYHTYTNGFLGVGGTDTYFYPSSTLRVRVLYVVWGQWIYLWTSQEAANQGFTWQNTSSTTVVHKGFFDVLAGYFSDPLFLLFFGMFTLIIIILLLAIFVPGVLQLGSAVASRGAERVNHRTPPPPNDVWRNPYSMK